jgi:hypothetical protein
MNFGTTDFYTTKDVLTHERLHELAPSIFTMDKKADLSERYNFVPTYQILQVMEDEGWLPVKAREEFCRTEGGQGFQRHMIRFRNFNQQLVVGDSILETILYNSHNGLASFIFNIGVWRVRCGNGMVVSEGVFEAIRVRHNSYEAKQIIAACNAIIRETPKIGTSINGMQKIRLNPAEQNLFAKSAAVLRFDDLGANDINQIDNLVDIRDILRARRDDDAGDDLWKTFNRTQENLVRGGVRYKRQDPQGRIQTRRSREIKGIKRDLKLNQAL